MSKNLTKKMAIIILIILLFSFISPLSSSNAISLAGVINKPITAFCMLILDGINSLLTLLLRGADAFDEVEASFTEEDFIAFKDSLIDPSKIFSNDVPMLNANIFEANSTTSFGTSGDSLGVILKKVVAGTYEVIRNLSAVILLVLLIYTGIRIVLASNSAQEKAKWNGILLDWVKALALVIFVHFIMVFIFWISDKLVDAINGATMGDHNFIAQIRYAFTGLEWDGAALSYWLLVIMYGYITYMTIVFALAYLKRLMYIVILIVIAPIIAVTYALGGQQKQIFGRWLKEYIMAVLLQPYHIIIYYILISLPLSMLNVNFGTGPVTEFFAGDNAFASIYALVAMSFIRPAERMVRDLVGMNQGIAREGSFDSGKAILDKGKEVVKDVAMVAGGAMTGNVQMAANGAAGLMNDTSSDGDPTGEPPFGPQPYDGSGLTPFPEEPPFGPQPYDGGGLTTVSVGSSNNGNLNVGTLTAGSMQGNNLQTNNVDAQNSNAENVTEPQGNSEDELNNKDIPQIAEPKKPLADRLADAIRYGDPRNGPNLLINNPLTNKIKDKAKDTDIYRKFEAKKDKVKERLDNPETGFGKIAIAGVDRTIAGVRYLKSDKGKEDLLKLGKSLGDLRETMYLGGQAPGDSGKVFENGLKKLEESGKTKIDQFIENKNNIQYMKDKIQKDAEASGKTIEQLQKETGKSLNELAKGRLEKAAEFLKFGVTDIKLADRLVDYKKENGLSAEQAVQQYARSEENKGAIRYNNFINNSVKMNAMQQIVEQRVAQREGVNINQLRSNPELIKAVQQEIQKEIKNAAPYIASGTAKNATDVVRMNRLEQQIKDNAKLAKGANIKEITANTEKIIGKALKEGVSNIKIPNSDRNTAIKSVEQIANRQLQERRRQAPNPQPTPPPAPPNP